MKRLILMAVIWMSVCATAGARQVITMTDGEEVEVEIVSIGTDDITYRKTSNPDGPTYTIARTKVFFITFDDGTKEIITPQNATSQPAAVADKKGTLGATLLQASLNQVNQDKVRKNYFPGITFFPHASIGYQGTMSGYKDQYDLEWSGFSYSVDVNVLVPTGDDTAYSIGLGFASLGGGMKMLYSSGGKSHKDKMGDFDAMYLTLPIEYFYQGSDLFRFGFGTRLELLVSQKMEGKKAKGVFNGFRDSLFADAMLTFAEKYNVGMRLLFNLTNALKGKDLDWSPTIGIDLTFAYTF